MHTKRPVDWSFLKMPPVGRASKVVARDRTTYSGFIDLYHICESSELKCLQIVLDHPGTEDTVAIQIRQYVDARIEALAG